MLRRPEGTALAAAALAALLAAGAPTCSAAGNNVGTGGQGGNAAGSGGTGGGGVLFGTSPDCQMAAAQATSVGCDYYAVDMDGLFAADNGCFVTFVANTSSLAAGLQVTFGDKVLDLSQFAKVPEGAGMSLTYAPYDPVAGIAPGSVAILFLAGHYAMDPNDKPTPTSPVKCPVPAAIPDGAQLHGTGRSAAFHIQSTEPVVVYQMLPYGAGAAAVTGASLLIPTNAWGKTYVAVDAYGDPQHAGTSGPSMSLVAMEDGTNVTITPNATIAAGSGVTGAVAGTATTYPMKQGEVLQITQSAELTGSPIQADKPIGLWAGHQCADTPADVQYCDHDEQQIPAVHALASEYVAVSYRQRTTHPENPPWRILGIADGTQLSYDPDVGGPATLDLGEVVEFSTATPFVVKSQDASHPFLLLAYMTGADSVSTSSADQGYGDPDIVRVVPPAQFLDRYVFFTDPTYPETNLVVVRTKGPQGFADVTLDCAGALGGWTPVGSDGKYEMTRTDLVRHDFQPQGNCNNGRHEMTSMAPFGVWVWAWGGPETQGGQCLPGSPGFSCYVSYGYPAGEGLADVNQIVFPPPTK